jgi:hypothetical protein
LLKFRFVEVKGTQHVILEDLREGARFLDGLTEADRKLMLGLAARKRHERLFLETTLFKDGGFVGSNKVGGQEKKGGHFV